jgi:pyrimidine and pyridine-specific 5'-nucleotidase
MNCDYLRTDNSTDAGVYNLAVALIDGYLEKNLKLRRNEAAKLHQDYVQDYGLAIEGLVRHHHIDPMEFNSQVDDALPLESIIEPRPELKKLLSDIDRKKVKLWLFTNAYKTHAQRVVKILEIDDFFDGLTYCDYSSVPFLCKPQKAMYLKAMREAGVQNMKNCFFVGK